MEEKQIFIIRHGQTRLNKRHCFIGTTDTPLNNMGKKQARTIKTILKEYDIQKVYSSPLKRAKQTAAIAFPRKYTLKRCLHERDFGALEGMTRDEGITYLQPHFPKHRFPKHGWGFIDGCVGTKPVEGEHIALLEKRVNTCFDGIVNIKAERIAIFSHAIWIKTLLKEHGLMKKGWEIGTGDILLLTVKGKKITMKFIHQ